MERGKPLATPPPRDPYSEAGLEVLGLLQSSSHMHDQGRTEHQEGLRIGSPINPRIRAALVGVSAQPTNEANKHSASCASRSWHSILACRM